MAELKIKNDELTTADLAGRAEKPREPQDRPQLVRNQPPEQPDYNSASPVPRRNPANEPRVPSNRAEMADVAAMPISAAERNQPGSMSSTANQPTPLFSESEVGDFRSRWGNIQTAFVDEPRRAVEDADNLVASLMKKLAEGFANERERLEKQWDRGDNVSTEDLRVALQRYRSFFDRLLKV
jgi:hypothetical protein